MSLLLQDGLQMVYMLKTLSFNNIVFLAKKCAFIANVVNCVFSVYTEDEAGTMDGEHADGDSASQGSTSHQVYNDMKNTESGDSLELFSLKLPR